MTVSAQIHFTNKHYFYGYKNISAALQQGTFHSTANDSRALQARTGTGRLVPANTGARLARCTARIDINFRSFAITNYPLSASEVPALGIAP